MDQVAELKAALADQKLAIDEVKASIRPSVDLGDVIATVKEQTAELRAIARPPAQPAPPEPAAEL